MTSLWELAALFLRLGATAFGGPAAHIAWMQKEVVEKRKWMSDAEFLDLLGAVNLIPGPNSTELAIHIGFARRRWAGLVVAGVCFILPAMLMTGALGWAYVTYGKLPEVRWLLYGVEPVILAVVVQAIVGLARRGVKGWWMRAIALAAAAAAALGVNELIVLAVAGVVAIARTRAKPGAALFAPAVVAPVATSAITLPGIFLVFAKIGAVLFGSGYVLLAFLRSELVVQRHWLTEPQLIDAIAVGQVTPGPVFTTATFVGYVLAGPTGALVATAGIFLPAFVFVAASGPLVPRIRKSPVAGAFLDGVNAASLALMAVVTVELGRAAIVDMPTILLGLAAAGALLRWKIDPTWLLLGGAVIGVAVHLS